ncbi:MAG: choice-of-anchor B family protein [Saprospiraceae bacterium]|nr:choice-of-anchor B family protein [Lewinellaceae bacterium]
MQRLFYLLLITLTPLLHTTAQNLNTTFRSKITFTNQTLANVWGYTSREGKEYALVGASKGLVIVDITDPDNPVQIVQIPGPNNLWKEIKTYSNYAYIVSEGGMGIQVVDLSGLPSPNLDSHFYTGDGAIAGQLGKIHALHIDTKKGFLYAWGGNLFNGGAKIFDLKQDPYNPVYVAKYDQLGYIHDGYVDNDTMYSAHIYAGIFAVVNMANKNAPELITTQQTPNAFTHNTWITDDRKTILTTDERNDSYLAAFDVSDLDNITLLDKVQSNPGSNSMVHNTYVWKNWAVTSWYKDGFTIVDITKPDNLVQVGNYDTYPASGGGSNGCWGVYAYFKSGTIIASNINALNSSNSELFIITPNYQRACYLEGDVTNAVSGAPISNATVEVLNSNPQTTDLSNANGIFKTGQTESGYFTVRVSKNGYKAFETLAYLKEGEVTLVHAALYPTGNLTVTGTVLYENTGIIVPNATVWLYGDQSFESTQTDMNGEFTFNNVSPGKYDLVAEENLFGLGSIHQIISTNTDVTIYLNPKHKRDEGQAGSLPGSSYLQAANPFSFSTKVSYSCPGSNCKLHIQNSVGQEISLLDASELSGELEIGQWLPRGLYFVQLEQGGEILNVLKLIKSE